MAYLRLYLILSVALAPAFAAASTDGDNRTAILSIVAVLAGYAVAVLLAAKVLRRGKSIDAPTLA